MSNYGAWSTSTSCYHGGLNQRYVTMRPYLNGGNPYTVNWAFSGAFTDSIVRSGYRTPNFHELKRRKAFIPPTQATLDLFKGRRAHLDLYQSSGGGYDAVSGDVWRTTEESSGGLSAWMNTGTAFASSNAISRTQQKAIARFFQKTKQTPFEGLVFTGELGESVRMISNRAHGLAEGIQQAYDHATLRRKTSWFDPLYQFRKFGIRPKRVSLGTLISQKAGYWLENCYGWQPMISDLQSAVEAVADYNYRHNGGITREVSFGGAKYEDTWTTVAGGVAFGPFANGVCQIKRKEKYEHRYGALQSMASAMKAGEFRDFARTINLRLSSVLPAVWELIPYSFVVDSFTNVGDIISAVCTDKSNLYGGWLVSVREIKVEKTFVLPSGSGSPQSYTSVKFLRAPWLINYNPSLTFHLPSAGGAANLTALALSKVKRLEGLLSVLS